MKAYGIGRIANDLTLQKTQTGKSVLNFTLACDKMNKKQLEKEGKPTADFIQCVAWSKTAELIAQYCQKGAELFVEGEVQTRSYKDNDGKTVYITEVLIDEMRFMSRPQTRQETPALNITEDNLPF